MTSPVSGGFHSRSEGSIPTLRVDRLRIDLKKILENGYAEGEANPIVSPRTSGSRSPLSVSSEVATFRRPRSHSSPDEKVKKAGSARIKRPHNQ